MEPIAAAVTREEHLARLWFPTTDHPTSLSEPLSEDHLPVLFHQ